MLIPNATNLLFLGSNILQICLGPMCSHACTHGFTLRWWWWSWKACHTHTPQFWKLFIVCLHICCNFVSFSLIAMPMMWSKAGWLKYFFLGAYKNSFHTIYTHFVSTVALFFLLVEDKMDWVSHDVPLVNSLDSQLFGCCWWWFLIRMMTMVPFFVVVGWICYRHHQKRWKKPLLFQNPQWQPSFWFPLILSGSPTACSPHRGFRKWISMYA